MDPRGQFTFYRSFADALRRIKKDADRAKAYDAICNYALYGIEPDLDSLPDSAAIAFDLIRPNLDSSKRKADNGRNGGKRKQSGSKAEANAKQGEVESEKEREKEGEIEKEIEIENECYINNNNNKARARKTVEDSFCLKIAPTPSTTCLREISEFVDSLGEDLCLRAIDAAVDAGVRNWNYIRAVLTDWRDKGYKTLDDVTRAETERSRKRPTKNGGEEWDFDDFRRNG